MCPNFNATLIFTALKTLVLCSHDKRSSTKGEIYWNQVPLYRRRDLLKYVHFYKINPSTFCQKQNLKHMATFYLKSTFIACLFNSFIRLFHSTQEIFIARTPNYKNKAQP